MRKGEGIALRLDDETRAALDDLARRLGTTNLSSVARIAIMSGYREINKLPEQLVRQAYREGVLSGVASFKSNLESTIVESLQDNPHNG
jgi:predicted transcriptional regulator